MKKLPQVRHPVTLSPEQLRAFCELFDATEKLVASIRNISESDEYQQLLELAHSLGHAYLGENLTKETNAAITSLIAVQNAFNIRAEFSPEEGNEE